MVNLTVEGFNIVLVTFAEFAAIRGCSKGAVTHATKSRITDAVVEKDGRRWLDRDLALELWNKNTMANAQSKVSRADAIEPLPADAAELKRKWRACRMMQYLISMRVARDASITRQS
jgi:hypothetical protein